MVNLYADDTLLYRAIFQMQMLLDFRVNTAMQKQLQVSQTALTLLIIVWQIILVIEFFIPAHWVKGAEFLKVLQQNPNTP